MEDRRPIGAKSSEVEEINNSTGHVITEDLISFELPDDILHIVLSKLPVRDAARSSVLSTRFRNLWRNSLWSRSDLVFDLDTVLGLGRSCVPSETQTATFITAVNLTQNDLIISSPTTTARNIIEAFKVHCTLRAKHAPHINYWVEFAVTRGVRKLHLRFNHKYLGLNDGKPYTFDFHLLSGGTTRSPSLLEELILRGCQCSLLPPKNGYDRYGEWRWVPHPELVRVLPHLQVFQRLRRLSLEQVDIEDADLAHLLSKTPVLAKLYLVTCSGLRDLKISSRSLKYFGYWGRGLSTTYLRTIEIDAEQLGTFEYDGSRHINVSFVNVPRLAHVSIFSTSAFSINSPTDIYRQLRTLFLNPAIASTYLFQDGWGEHSFENLVELVIVIPSPCEQYDAVKLSCFLHKLPFLQKLCVNVCKTSTRWKQFVEYLPQPRTISATVHRHLRVVEFCGFFGRMNELQLAVYLLKKSISLELMSISFSLCAYKGDGKWVKKKQRSWEEKKTRDLVYQLLSKAASPRTRLVVE